MSERILAAGPVAGAVRVAAPPAVLDCPEEKAASRTRRSVLLLSNVRKTYTSGTGEVTHALRGINLEIEAGSFNVIRGESGSGKTSLLRILGMLDTQFDGKYLLMGDDVKEKPDWYRDELRSNNIGFIFQEGQLFAHLTLYENISIPLRLLGTLEERRAIRERITDLAPKYFDPMKELANNILSNRPIKVSGGQKQRAAIMRSVINRPAIILADEPTASLDEARKEGILKLLKKLCDDGHTVIVVSHDKVFHGTGRQLHLYEGSLLDLSECRLLDIAPDQGDRIAERPPAKGSEILYGWRPRAPLGILLRQAVVETFLRPIFLFLILVSLCVGVCQIGVFASIIVGAQTFLNEAMTRGSRLNRLEVKPRTSDLDKADRFPVLDAIKTWGNVQAILPRRATLARVLDHEGEKTVYSAMGLQKGDPEYRLLTFVAGGPFSESHEELETIVTVALLTDLFSDATGIGEANKQYSDFIGRYVEIEIPQFAKTGQELAARAKRVKLKLVGIILFAEGGRQLYLPNRTQLVFDRYKMDREGAVVLPLNETGDAWAEDRSAIAQLADFPWEDQLHIYTKEIRDIIPVFQQLSQLGYKPASDIWNYKWVLDVRDIAWNIFIPLLGLIVLAVGLTVATNLFTSAKLREKEFALWRILGMRRGDLVITQVVSTILAVLAGAALGLLIGGVLVDSARAFLAEQSPGAGLEKVFAPVGAFYAPILICAVVVGIASAVYPSIRTARADPAKVLQT